MQSRIELEIETIHERLRVERAAAARRRQEALLQRPHGLGRRVARPLGRALLSLGARLLRYANAERLPLAVSSPRGGAIELN